MVYNLTNLTAANGVYGQIEALNDLSGGILGIFLVATIFLILMMVFKQNDRDTKEIFMASAMLTSIIGVLFWTTGLIGTHILIYPIIAWIASILIYKFTG